MTRDDFLNLLYLLGAAYLLHILITYRIATGRVLRFLYRHTGRILVTTNRILHWSGRAFGAAMVTGFRWLIVAGLVGLWLTRRAVATVFVARVIRLLWLGFGPLVRSWRRFAQAWSRIGRLDGSDALKLCLIVGISSFVYLLLIFRTSGVSEMEEWFIYVLYFSICPLLVLAPWLAADSPATPRAAGSRRLLLAANGLLVLAFSVISGLVIRNDSEVFVNHARITSSELYMSVGQAGKEIPLLIPVIDPQYYRFILPAFAIVQVVLLGLSFAHRSALARRYPIPESRSVRYLEGLIFFLLPFALFYLVLPDIQSVRLEEFFRRADFHLGLALGAAIFVAVILLRKWNATGLSSLSPMGRGAAVAIAVLGAFALFDIDLVFDYLHFGAYVGPANAVAGGRAPLVEIQSQYGLNYLLFSAVFDWLPPRSYYSAAIVVGLVNTVFYLIFLGILFRVLRSAALACIGGLLMLFVYKALLPYNISITPSVAGFRFMPPLLLVLALVHLPRHRNFTGFSVLATVLCALWSAEAIFFGLLTYLAAVSANNLVGRRGFGVMVRDVVLILSVPFVSHLVLSGGLFAIFDRPPRYDFYLSLIGRYRFDDIGWLMPISPWFLTWGLPALAYFLVFALALRQFVMRPDDRTPGSDVWLVRYLFPLAALGSLEAACYVSRSIPAILVTVSFPFLILMLAAIDRFVVAPPVGVRRWTSLRASFAAVALGVFALGGGIVVDQFAQPYDVAGANATLIRRCFTPKGCDLADIFSEFGEKLATPSIFQHYDGEAMGTWPALDLRRAREVTDLVHAHGLEGGRIVIFMPEATPVMVYTRTVHRFPVSNNLNDQLSRPIMLNILMSPVELDEGELVFALADESKLEPYERALLGLLRAKWRFCIEAVTDHGAVVYRLTSQPRCNTT